MATAKNILRWKTICCGFLMLSGLLASFPLSAQKKPKGKKNSIGIVAPENNNGSKRKYHIDLRVNPFMIPFGELPFYVEVPALQSLRIELGIGPTFKQLIPTMDKAINESSLDLYNREIKDDLHTDRGLVVRASLKLYFPESAVEGLYMEGSLRHKTTNLVYTPPPHSFGPSEPAMLNSVYNDFLLDIGAEQKIGGNFYWDCYAGLGYRLFHLEAMQKIMTSYGSYYAKTVFTRSDFPIALDFGLKIGYKIRF
jgi:hypothetical protein